MKYFSDIKRGTILSCITMGMNLKYIMLSGVSQTEMMIAALLKNH